NKEFIENTFINIEGNVTLHKDGDGKYYFVSKNPDKTTTTTYFNEMEFKTSLKTGEVTADGIAPSFAAKTTAPDESTVKKGEIFYEYVTEGENGKELNYINLTQDLITTINNNEELKEDITNIVNNFLEGGSNVYYGKIDPKDTTAKDILFSVDKDGNRTPIDISQNIINEITNNTEVKNTIKKVTRIELEESQVVSINTSLNKAEVYRLLKTVTVTAASANTPYNNVLSAPVDLGANATKVLSIQLLNQNGSVVLNTARDIELDAGKLSFVFGNGQTILPLKPGNYEIIVEFTATTP
ncbi:hypothetical protein ACYSNX_03605, partial [Myroides sp. LJL115]